MNEKYEIIYADPPWRYANMGLQGSPEDHYSTMNLQGIKDLIVEGRKVNDLAADNSTLFMWATMPLLNEALEVINAWGFKYTTCAFTWVKQNPLGSGIYLGLGHWTRGNAELCLFAKKGKPKRQAKDVRQIIMAPRGRHSAKPAETRDRIVSLMGDLPRIELFARETAPGWKSWGNEIDPNGH